jgi:EpsI family protein
MTASDRVAGPGRLQTTTAEKAEAGVSSRVEASGKMGRIEGSRRRNMSRIGRVILCGSLLTIGLAAQAALERYSQTERPPLLRPLASIPMELGDWIGQDEPVDPEIVERAQTTEYLNRVYESRKVPGLRLRLWINYAREGTNLRHTPEICLPSGGWTKIESQTSELTIPSTSGRPTRVTRLAYSRGELVESIGFWYYIFGEGRLENLVRQLPITSRSSHGRTTLGSSMTIEVFYPGDSDPDAAALQEFAGHLVDALDPILPRERAAYHIP